MSYFILSFDGGGIRGALSAEVMNRLGPKAVQRANLFAGTSTGAFIALGLAAGLAAQDLVDLYAKAGPKLFTPAKGPLEKMLGLEAVYTNTALKKELEAVFAKSGLDPHGPLSQLKKRVVIVAFKLKDQKTGRWEPVILSNPSDVSIIDAALMSSAAPSYFPSYKGYVDGGVCANNPSVVALSLAVSEGRSLDEISLLSIGTGFVEHDLSKQEAWGAVKWIINLFGSKAASSHPLVSLFYDAEEELANINCMHLLGDRFFRLNTKMKKGVRLDDVTAVDALIELGKKADLKGVVDWMRGC